MSAIYRGTVMHRRVRPVAHALRYRVFTLLLDVDRLADTARGLRLLSYNRFNLFAFFDRDHGNRDGSPLRPWVEARLQDAGLGHAAHRILLLSFPRILGYVFNPLSVYFCFAADGNLDAVLYEVKNTFGEQHVYVLASGSAGMTQNCEKGFHVSPFLSLQGHYRFRIRRPEKNMSLTIQEGDRDGVILTAALAGRRHALSDRSLLACFFAYPLMTLKVIAVIHVEAARLWLKGLKVYTHPRTAAPRAPMPEQVSQRLP